jgi:hypothetical protein
MYNSELYYLRKYLSSPDLKLQCNVCCQRQIYILVRSYLAQERRDLRKGLYLLLGKKKIQVIITFVV